MSGQNLELALKLKIAQTGLENIQNLIGELKSAGIATDGLEADAAKLAAELNSVDGATKKAAASTEKSTQAYSGAAKGVRSISEQLAEARTALLAYIGAQSAIGAADNLTNLADEYKSLEARIKLAVGEQGNLKTAMDAVSQTALRTGQNLNTVGALYASLGRSTQASQEQIAALTDTIAKATALSGGSAESANAAITQLNQSLDSGVFRGDEFNSVMEQAPIIGDALAKSLGVTRGELRAMAADGKLTADVVTKALLDQKAAIDESFSKLPLTISRAKENVKTNFALMVGELDKTSGASTKVAEAINGIANNLDSISRIAIEAGAVLATAFAVKAVPAIIDFSKELVVATRNAGSLRAVLAAMPTNLKITLAVVGLTAAIEGARKLGEGLASMGPAAEAAAAAQAKAREQIQSVLNRQIDLIEANEKYKNTTILSTQEVAKLSDEERARYQASIEGAKRYNAALATAGFAQKELGIDVVKGSEDAAKALGGLRTALADIEVVSKLSKEAIDQMLTLNASVLIKQFDDVLSKTNDVKKALEGLTKAADFTSLTGIQGYGEALQKLGEDGKLSADQIKKAWTEALGSLSNDQLAAFAINAKAAFNSGERDAAALAEALKAQVSVAAQRAGVDIEQALGKVTPATQTALGNINALQQGLEAAGYTAKDQATVISSALEKAIPSAKTTADIAAIKEQYDLLGKTGQRSAGEMAALKDQIDAQRLKIEQTIPGIQSMAEAYAALGITSHEALQKQADDSELAYQKLKDMGAPLADLVPAFKAYADASAKANNGAYSSAVLAEAAQYGLKDSLIAAGAAAVQASPAFKELGDAYADAAENAKRKTESVERATQADVAAAEQALNAAKATGNATAVGQAEVALADKKAAAAQQVADAKQAEADAAQNYVTQVRQQVSADGEVTASDERVIASAQQVADSKQDVANKAQEVANKAKQEADAAEKSAKANNELAESARVAGSYTLDLGKSLTTAMGSMIASTRGVHDLNAGMRGLLDNIKSYTGDETLLSMKAQSLALDEQAKQADKAAAAWQRIGNNVAALGASEYYGAFALQSKMAAAIAETNKQINDLNIGLYEIKQAADTSNLSLEDQLSRLNDLKAKYRDLDKSKLTELQRQIDDVTGKLKSMQDQADQTLQSLQEELAQQQGNYAQAAQIEGAQKLLRLQEQLNEAKAAGNQSAVTKLNEALHIQQQLNDAAIQEARTREQQAKADAANKNTPPATKATTENATPVKTVNVRLTLPNGQTKTVTTTQGSEDALLSALESLGARS